MCEWAILRGRHYLALNAQMMEKRRIGNDLEGNCRGLIVELSRYVARVSEESHEKHFLLLRSECFPRRFVLGARNLFSAPKLRGSFHVQPKNWTNYFVHLTLSAF